MFVLINAGNILTATIQVFCENLCVSFKNSFYFAITQFTSLKTASQRNQINIRCKMQSGIGGVLHILSIFITKCHTTLSMLVGCYCYHTKLDLNSFSRVIEKSINEVPFSTLSFRQFCNRSLYRGQLLSLLQLHRRSYFCGLVALPMYTQ